MKKTLGTSGACLLFFQAVYAVGSKEVKPNIILINIDDLGWTDLSCNGSSYYETPNIDRLKHAGVWFSSAYAGASNSAPSRASLLTGHVTPRHGVFTVDPADRGKKEDRKLLSATNREFLSPSARLLPQVLKEAGYQTCHIGKWHVTANPIESGMDINIAGSKDGHPSSYFSPYKNSNLIDGPKGENLTDRLGEEAVKYLSRVDKSKPFFLYFATYAVHTPLQSKPELIAKYKQKIASNSHANPVYAAMVEEMDASVGRLLQAVDSLQLSNTLIVLTSDNGGVYDISRQWPLRAGKGSFYEGGIRIPLIMYMKGKYEGGKSLDVPVNQLDLFPTFTEIAGIGDSRTKPDGQSLLPLLKGKANKSFANRAMFWHFPAYLEGGNVETTDTVFRSRPVSVIRKGDWKLIENYETGMLELYNIKVDISEKNNLFEKEKQRANRLYQQLNAWKKSTQAPIPDKLNPYYKK